MDLTGATGRDEERDPDEPEEQTACLLPAGEAATGGGVDESRPQRHGGQRQGRHAGRNLLLGDADHAVAREQQRDADHRGRQPLSAPEAVG